jgi:hypothetical protein
MAAVLLGAGWHALRLGAAIRSRSPETGVEEREEEIVVPRIGVALEMIRSFVTEGIEKTMNAFNKR